MRQRIFLITTFTSLIAGYVSAPVIAEESEKQVFYINTEFSTDSIYYGDVVFARFSIENRGRENIVIAKSAIPFNTSSAYQYTSLNLFNTQDQSKPCFEWRSPYEVMEVKRGVHGDQTSLADYHYLKPGEKHEVGFLPIWIPHPENLDEPVMMKLKNEVRTGFLKFYWKYPGSGFSGKPVRKEDIEKYTKVDLWTQGQESDAYKWENGVHYLYIYKYGYVTEWKDAVPFTISNRPDDELELLRKWFTIFPETCERPEYYAGAVFTSPKYLQDQVPAAMYIPAYMKKEEMELEIYNRYSASKYFIAKFKSRTPEVEKRIQRCKELERQLLERAAKEDSTISSQMKDFIIIRGHLVDIKYANSPEEMEKYYRSMLSYIFASENRDLWIKYLKWIVLHKRYRTDVVPDQDIDRFIQILNDRIEQLN